jgi:hypothetical protein
VLDPPSDEQPASKPAVAAMPTTVRATLRPRDANVDRIEVLLM